MLFFIAIGIGHINGANYHLPPGGLAGMGGYFPFGVTGMLGGAAFIFFAYIGFDAVSTTAEEAESGQGVCRSASSASPFARFFIPSSSRFSTAWCRSPWASLTGGVRAQQQWAHGRAR